MAYLFLALWLAIGGGGGYAALAADAPGWVVAVLAGGSGIAAAATTAIIQHWNDNRLRLTASEKRAVREYNEKSPATHEG